MNALSGSARTPRLFDACYTLVPWMLEQHADQLTQELAGQHKLTRTSQFITT